jgi:hypothetical protein
MDATDTREVPTPWATLRRRFPGPILLRALRDGLSIGGVLLLYMTMRNDGPGNDFFAYWAVDPANPYAVREGFGAFHYAPPLVWLVGPLKLIGWPTAYWLWFGFLMLVLVWLARGWALAWLMFPPVPAELFHGNVHLLIAAALVLSLRYPAAYVFLVLSKVAPGVTAIWWAIRGEWRSLGVALGAAGLLIAVSILLAPSQWIAWVSHISVVPDQATNLLAVPLLVRLPLAAGLVAIAAWRNQPWLLAPAVVAALPLLWFHGLAVLVAITPLWRMAGRGEQAKLTTSPPADSHR